MSFSILIVYIPIPLYGDGLNSRDLLNVRDPCRAINLVIESGVILQVYNIGGGSELSNIELAKLLLDEFGLDDSFITHVNDRKGHDRRYSVSYKKIADECGFKPEHNFEESLNETIDWYRSNEAWWRPLKSRSL